MYHTVSGSPKVPRNRFAPAPSLRLCLRHGTMQGFFGSARPADESAEPKLAPQKSAKRKRVHWVPCSLPVSEGSAEPFCSGSLAASVPAARYDANCCKMPFSAGQCVLRVNSLPIYTNRKRSCHTKSSLLLRGGDFFLPFYSSLLAVHNTGTPHRFFRKRGFSLYKRKDFPWPGWGSVFG